MSLSKPTLYYLTDNSVFFSSQILTIFDLKRTTMLEKLKKTISDAGDSLKEQASNVTDAIKDHPTVKAEVKDGVITLTGEIKKDALKKLMPLLQSLKPKKVDNKLTVN